MAHSFPTRRSSDLFVEHYGTADIWQFVVQPVLNQPASAVFGVLSVVLILLGRKKRPLIGYARD